MVSRRLIVCCDGTWNDPADRTHIKRIDEMVAPQDATGIVQLHQYFPGVGVIPGSRLLGGIFGYGLSERVREAYRWLAERYQEGDEIFAFGFSRGAYTVRSLGGFINYAGLLAPAQLDLLPSAYAAYRLPAEQRATHPFQRQLPELAALRPWIRFLGVFDTVGALGVPLPWLKKLLDRNVEFHDTQLSSIIECACQALGIDERRGPYRPTLWTGAPRPLVRPDGRAVEQQVHQVWFAGVHSDVGGGYPEPALGNLALEWMLMRARACGLALDGELRPPPDPAGSLHDSFTRGWWLAHQLPSIDEHVRPIGPSQRRARRDTPAHEHAVIGERLHPSALDRHSGAAAQRLRGPQWPYQPKTLPVADVDLWREPPAPLSDAA
jgi:uncharacterized protein (DUF2235 family)